MKTCNLEKFFLLRGKRMAIFSIRTTSSTMVVYICIGHVHVVHTGFSACCASGSGISPCLAGVLLQPPPPPPLPCSSELLWFMLRIWHSVGRFYKHIGHLLLRGSLSKVMLSHMPADGTSHHDSRRCTCKASGTHRGLVRCLMPSCHDTEQFSQRKRHMCIRRCVLGTGMLAPQSVRNFSKCRG